MLRSPSFDKSWFNRFPMPPKCPRISETLIFAGNSGLAAQLSCLFAAPAVYVPIMDAPRLQRPDGRSEIVRRGNAAARSRARRFIFAGLTDEECKGLATIIPARRTVRIDGTEALEGFIAAAARNDLDTITWGRDRIGIGLLKAFGPRPISASKTASRLEKRCLRRVITWSFASRARSYPKSLPRTTPTLWAPILSLSQKDRAMRPSNS